MRLDRSVASRGEETFDMIRDGFRGSMARLPPRCPFLVHFSTTRLGVPYAIYSETTITIYI